MFHKSKDGCKDCDLQPFGFNVSDGTITAATMPHVLGTDIWALKDKNGEACGQVIYRAAREGKITEVSSLFPRPGTDTTLLQKVSVITGIGDQGYGAGYFTWAAQQGPQREKLVSGATYGFRSPNRGSERRWRAHCTEKEA